MPDHVEDDYKFSFLISKPYVSVAPSGEGVIDAVVNPIPQMAKLEVFSSDAPFKAQVGALYGVRITSDGSNPFCYPAGSTTRSKVVPG